MRITSFHRPWWCDVFRLQRIAIGETVEDVAMNTNSALGDTGDDYITDDDYAAIERGEVVPSRELFDTIAGSLWMEVTVGAAGELRLGLENFERDDPTSLPEILEKCTPAFFSRDCLSVGETEVREWRKQWRQPVTAPAFALVH